MNYWLIAYIFISLFIAWIWIDYYRMLEAPLKKKSGYILMTFFMGCASVMLIDLFHYFLSGPINDKFNGNPFNTFFVFTFLVGVPEECTKLIPFLIMLLLFKKQLTEPIDYIAFASFSALGFSASENVEYFLHNSYIVDARSTLSSLSHMIDSSLAVYGLLLCKFKYNKFKPFVFIKFLFIAILLHGAYDTICTCKQEVFRFILLMPFFMLIVSLLVTIINNALSNSSIFTYKKVIESNKIEKKLLIYYGIVAFAQFLIFCIKINITYAIYVQIYLTFIWLIVLIIILRLSRFKLIKGEWSTLKIELPFSVLSSKISDSSGSTLFDFHFKGESNEEIAVNKYYQEYFELNTIGMPNYSGKRIGYIEKKIFLKNDESFFLTKIFNDTTRTEFGYVLMKPKTKGTTKAQNKYPIVSLLRIGDPAKLLDKEKSITDFKFIEWNYIKPTSQTL